MKPKQVKSPLIPRILVSLLTRSAEKATIYGDMEELFQETVQSRGIGYAKRWYWMEAFHAQATLIIHFIKGGLMMVNNYFKSACRNLLKNKGFSFINIFGLAIGMTCCLLILMFVKHEISYDRYNENTDRIYRVASEIFYGGRHHHVAVLPAGAASTFIREFPEVENAVRFRNRGSFVIEYNKTFFKEKRIIFCDNSFFNVFTIPLLEGDPETVLAEPKSVVMNRKTAMKYFGNESPIGKILSLDNEKNYRVTGIFDDFPNNSHIQFDIMVSLNSLKESDPTNWLSDNFNTYLLLGKNADPKQLEKKFPGIIRKFFGAALLKATGKSFDKMEANGDVKMRYYLQPLTKIHLHSNLTAELGNNGDIKYVYIFFAIAVFVLIIAAINFMNLSTARSANRAKEVGLRKVIGSQRWQLIYQFLTESMVLSFISIILALFMVYLILPYFNHLSGKELSFAIISSGGMILAIMGIVVLVGLFAGIYPAFVISAFKPVSVLQGRQRRAAKSGKLRNFLVVFQFTASIILIIGTMVIGNQMRFIQNKKLGYEKDRLLVLDDTYMLEKQAEVFKDEMLKNPDIKTATLSGFLPVPSSRSNNVIVPEGNIINEKSVSVQNWSVDYDYIPTMGMKIVEGRNFSKMIGSDSNSVIINQQMAAHFDWKEPIGKQIGSFISNKGEVKMYTVVGVIENFHFESMRRSIDPIVMFLRRNTGMMTFRLSGSNISGTIDFIRRGWNRFLPGQPFDFKFMDESFDSVYREEYQMGKIFGNFAVLAIFIGCLGLFGLAAFMAEQRTKEIGIRKVLGATISKIVVLLSREFFLLVGIANLLAWPLAYILMSNWLGNFAYKSSLKPGIFLLAGVVSMAIALLTTSFQAVKAALMDPVKSVKHE